MKEKSGDLLAVACGIAWYLSSFIVYEPMVAHQFNNKAYETDVCKLKKM